MRKKYVIASLSVFLLAGAYSGLWVASVSDGYVRLWRLFPFLGARAPAVSTGGGSVAARVVLLA